MTIHAYDIYDLFNKRVKINKSSFSNPIPNSDTVKLYCLNYFFSGCDIKKMWIFRSK
jgi:hypothetical protein